MFNMRMITTHNVVGGAQTRQGCLPDKTISSQNTKTIAQIKDRNLK